MVSYTLAAVAGSREKGSRSIKHIPPGATIQVEGEVDGAGMVAVDWKRQSYYVFERDMADKCSKIGAAPS